MDRLISEKSVMEVIYGCDWLIDEEHAEVIKERIRSISSAEPKTGHWTRELIRNEKGGCIGAKMICSECGNDNRHDEYMNYCPSCGAKMVEPQKARINNVESNISYMGINSSGNRNSVVLHA